MDLSFERELLGRADRCVACGMCLPVCPTYRLSQLEAESARGRIALIRGMMQGQLQPSKTLAAHLDSCLACRACEAVCPAAVPFGEMIDDARIVVRLGASSSMWRRLLVWLLRWVSAHHAWWEFARRHGYRINRGLLARMLHRLGIPDVTDAGAERCLATVHQPRSAFRGEVELFLGCVARAVDDRTIDDAIFVLTQLGYRVRVPETQGCCGALHKHQGDRHTAVALARRNIGAFKHDPDGVIITTASGCGAMLAEYGSLIPGDPTARRFSSRVMDIGAYLHDRLPASLPASSKRVLIHEPCTLQYPLRQRGTTRRLLARIAHIDLLTLPRENICCGAAGVYHLLHPDKARTLRSPIIEYIVEQQPHVLVTSNVGCAMHIRAGLAQQKIACDVVHPISFIASQLRAAPV